MLPSDIREGVEPNNTLTIVLDAPLACIVEFGDRSGNKLLTAAEERPRLSDAAGHDAAEHSSETTGPDARCDAARRRVGAHVVPAQLVLGHAQSPRGAGVLGQLGVGAALRQKVTQRLVRGVFGVSGGWGGVGQDDQRGGGHAG